MINHKDEEDDGLESEGETPREGSPNENELKQCLDGQYVKTNFLISKSHYRTIYRGQDNESGCEIAWCVYTLK